MESHLRPLVIIAVLAVLLAGVGAMLWPQKSSAPVNVPGNASSSVIIFKDEDGLNTGLSKDANHVYNTTVSGTLQVIAGADPKSFTLVGSLLYSDMLGGWYFKDINHVYYVDLGGALTVMRDADSATFNIIPVNTRNSSHYGKPNTLPSTLESCGQGCTYDSYDEGHKYLEGQVVQGASASATTTILDSKGNPSDFFSVGDTVYWSGGSEDPNYHVVVLGADRVTFVVFENDNGTSDFAKDKYHGYYGDKIISNYPNTFAPLSFRLLYSDGHQVFDAWGQVVSNDAGHFVQVQIPQSKFLCAKDSSSFYLCSNQSAEIHAIAGSDPATFVVLKTSDGQDSLYGKDKNLVYWFGEPDGYPAPNVTIVQNADPATFQVLSGQSTYDAQDKNHKYLQGQVVQ